MNGRLPVLLRWLEEAGPDTFACDAGLRTDHLLLSPDLAKRLQSGGVETKVSTCSKTSDRAPVRIELADAKTPAGRKGQR